MYKDEPMHVQGGDCWCNPVDVFEHRGIVVYSHNVSDEEPHDPAVVAEIIARAIAASSIKKAYHTSEEES